MSSHKPAAPDALTQKLGTFLALGREELAMLDELQGPRTYIPAGKEVVYQGQHGHAAYVLREGWACSYKRLIDGSRQIIDIGVPGDFLGLRSLLLRTSDQSFVTLTDVEVRRVVTSKLWDAFRKTPRLAGALLWAVSRDEAMVVEHLVSIGRRDALARTAHFLLELGARMRLVGRGSHDSYECPLSQSMLADALGMTAIHLNRVLRQLRESNLLVFREGVVRFIDREKLADMIGFDLSYLDQGGPVLD
ncbi:Crp/Fnr family transcriptional regulator [Aquamicrobium sp. LC103]|uniref:Crp/Fnr family transcriptional regulator n=1 Tax=Aquamicrobium sp. LC103 TaxID=1120658 RepID=UPI00063EC026|nr:Crp/Fnr family transcriptional regulator [Aquamicrobium sp. LC103]TKT80283.1 Crp/Fnr family transcriptional regulator [Aquamicrobium sp. LC103]